MSTHEMAEATTSTTPETAKRRRGVRMRGLTRPRIAATAAVAAFGLSALTAGAASASTMADGPTIQLGNYAVPSSAPQYVTGGDLLPQDNGTLGDPASIVMTGSGGNLTADNQAVTIPNDTITFATQTSTSAMSTSPAQTWYFQRVGYAGVTTPAMTDMGGTDMLGVPVYKIINYNPDGMHTCLEAFGNQPAAGSIVDINGCNLPNQTNQLWVIGTAGQTNDTMNATTGAFDGNSSPQIYSRYLQGSTTGQPGLSNSVIENVATLQANGWNTSQAPVLTADSANLAGVNSPLTLQSQQWPATSQNSTWTIVPGYNFNAPGSSGGDCAGVTGYEALVCGGGFQAYYNWVNSLPG